MIGLQVLGDRVLVALPPRQDEFVSTGGIVLMKDPDRLYAPTQGIVVQVGEKSRAVDIDDVVWIMEQYDHDAEEMDRQIRALRPTAFDVAVGDCVLFPRSAGEQVTLDGIDYVILRELEILGIVEPKNQEAA